MNRRSNISFGQRLARTWLAGLLVCLLLALSVGSVVHHDHQDHQEGSHTCAACLLAHGGLLANGTTGATVVSSPHSFALPVFAGAKSASHFDLRLAPGRAPPV